MNELKRSPRKLGLLVPSLLAASGCDDEATVLTPALTPSAAGAPDEPLYVTPAGGASKLFEVEGWAFKTFRLR